MMDVTELITEDRVAAGVEARSKKRALEIVAELLAVDDGDIGHAAVFASLVGRERLGSTAIGHGVALPHGRVEGVTVPIGALIRLTEPVDFEADDGEPVDLVFGVIVPPECGDAHLAALAAVADVFTDEPLRAALRTAEDGASMLALIHERRGDGA